MDGISTDVKLAKIIEVAIFPKHVCRKFKKDVLHKIDDLL